MNIFQVKCIETTTRWSKWYFYWPILIGFGSAYVFFSNRFALGVLEQIGLILLFALAHKLTDREISRREFVGFEITDEGESLSAHRMGERFFDISKDEIDSVGVRSFLGIFRYFVITDKSGFEYKLDLPDGKVVVNDINKLRFV